MSLRIKLYVAIGAAHLPGDEGVVAGEDLGGDAALAQRLERGHRRVLGRVE